MNDETKFGGAVHEKRRATASQNLSRVQIRQMLRLMPVVRQKLTDYRLTNLSRVI